MLMQHGVQPRTEEELEKAEARLLKRQVQRKRKLEEAGIKYDFESVAYVSSVPILSPRIALPLCCVYEPNAPLTLPPEKEAETYRSVAARYDAEMSPAFLGNFGFCTAGVWVKGYERCLQCTVAFLSSAQCSAPPHTSVSCRARRENAAHSGTQTLLLERRVHGSLPRHAF